MCSFVFFGLLFDTNANVMCFLTVAIIGGAVLPNYADICASIQYAVFRHLARKVMRAFEYVKCKGWVPDNSGYPKTLVITYH